jgi:hypothetical protein
MKVILHEGEKVEVEFAESDGQITVEFNPTDLIVKADMPDTDGRTGIIYQEKFGAIVTEEELLAGLKRDFPQT